MEIKVLGRKVENKYYVSSLSHCLDKRFGQMQELMVLESEDDKSNAFFTGYNQQLKKFQNICLKTNKQSKVELNQFISSFNALKEVAGSLKQYQQRMMFYRYLPLSQLKKLNQQSYQLEEKMAGILSVGQRKIIQHNKVFIEGECFYDILQVRSSIQSFLNYLKIELQREVACFEKPFLQRVLIVLSDPINLWSKKGWQLVMRKEEGKEAIVESSLKLKKLCEDVLLLNSLQFQYVCQSRDNHKGPLSSREQDSIKSLLMDPSIQKQLLLKGIIQSDELPLLNSNWKSVFYKMNTPELSVVEGAKSKIKKEGELIEKENQIMVVDILETLDAIEDADAAFRCFGLQSSLLDIYKKISKPSIWRGLIHGNNKSENHYEQSMKLVYAHSKKFFAKPVVSDMTRKEYLALLLYIDKLTLLHQTNEQYLIKSDLGRNFLDIISLLLEQLTQFQIQSNIQDTMPIKEQVKPVMGILC